MDVLADKHVGTRPNICRNGLLPLGQPGAGGDARINPAEPAWGSSPILGAGTEFAACDPAALNWVGRGAGLTAGKMHLGSRS